MRIRCSVICKIILCHVCRIDRRFCCKKVVSLKPDLCIIIVRYFKRSCHLAIFKMLLYCLYKFKFFRQRLIHSCLLCDLCNSSVKDFNIRENEFKIDCLNISCRVNGTIYMDNVCILKTAYYMNNCIYFTNICQELVS